MIKNKLFLIYIIILSCNISFAKDFDFTIKSIDNDIKNLYITEKSSPVVNINILIKDAGYSSDGNHPRAVAATAGMVLNISGGGDISSSIFRKKIAETTSQVSFSQDADFLLISIKTMKNKIDDIMPLISAKLTKPTITNKDLNIIKAKAKSAYLDCTSEPNCMAENIWYMNAYKNTIYQDSYIAKFLYIQGINVQNILKFLQERITKENMQVSIVGNLSDSEVAKILDKYFTNIPNKNEYHLDNKELKINQASEVIHQEIDVPQSVIMFGTNANKIQDKQNYTAMIFNEALAGSGLNSILMQDIRDKQGLTYGIYAKYNHMSYADNWIGSFATDGINSSKAVDALKFRLKDVAKNGISQEKFATTKSYMINSFPLKFTTNRSLTNNLSTIMWYNLPTNYIQDYINNIQSVTLEDVNHYASKLLQENNILIVIAGKKQK
jgi:zinc protease